MRKITNHALENGACAVYFVTEKRLQGLRSAVMYALLSRESVNTAVQCHPRIYVSQFGLQGTATAAHHSETDVMLRGSKVSCLCS